MTCGQKRSRETSVRQKTERFEPRVAHWFVRHATLADWPALAEKHDADVRLHQLKKVSRWMGRNGRVDYYLGRMTEGIGAGRWYASGSYQSWPVALRGLLARDQYWDLDMVNAQPTLLWQYAAKRGWAAPHVERFCCEREQLLAAVMENGMSRDEAKGHMTALIFGGSAEKARIAGLPAVLTEELAPELRRLRDAMWRDSDFADWRKAALKGNSETEAKNTLVAFVLHTEERRVLEVIEQALTDDGRQMDTYIFDGGLVRRLPGEAELPSALLRRVEAHVLATVGYAIKVCVKRLDTSLTVGAVTKPTYSALKATVETEDRLALIKSMGSFTLLNKATGRLQIVEQRHLELVYKPLTFVDAELKEHPFFPQWLQDPERASYEDIGFWHAVRVRWYYRAGRQ